MSQNTDETVTEEERWAPHLTPLDRFAVAERVVVASP
jgi:hypothetical protein